MALLCPLCMGVSFTSEETLLYDLIAFSSRSILCPLCSEVIKGFDKFTVHLCSHVLKCDANPIALNINQNMVSLNEKLKGIDLRRKDDKHVDLRSTNIIETCHSTVSCGDLNLDGDVTKYSHAEPNYLMQFSKSEVNDENSESNKNDHNALTNLTIDDNVWPLQVNIAGNLESLLDDSMTPPGVNGENSRSIKNGTALANFTTGDNVWPLHKSTTGNLELDGSAIPLNRDEEIPPENNPNILHVDLSNDNVPVTVVKNDREIDPSGNINQNAYDCTSCSTSFPKSAMLKLHNELMHSNGTRNVLGFKYQCHQCQKKFKIKGSLVIHQRVAHHSQNDERTLCKIPTEENQSKDSQYHCNICFKFFKKEYYLNQHLKTHEGKKWSCEECGKMFTTRYFLKKHKLLHTGEMPYSCFICDKSFTFQQSYHRHMLYHNDEKPYSCDDCGKSFKELSTLYNHQRIHTGEKPYSCSVCGKSFRQRVACLVHSRIHSGSKVFKCSLCQRSFKYKVSLRSHKCSLSTEVGLGNIID